MKCLIKPIGFLALLLFSSQAFSQGNGWSIGVGAGYMNYYGDLSPKLGPVIKDHYKIKANDRSLDFGVFLERKLSSGTNFVINANMGSFKANDLTASDSTYFDRSLNFRTEVQDLSGTLHFKTNNGRLLPQNSIIAPYFFVGLGVTQFETFGDLKDAQGNLYVYDGTEEVEQDGDYETNLSDLKVEKAAKQTIMNIPFGAGIRFNTGKNWSLNLQTDVKYMFTDYIDDVSKIYRDGDDFESSLQEYASNPNPRVYSADSRGKSDGIKNDLYMFTSLSLRFNFGRKRAKGFVPPVFPPSGNSTQTINGDAIAGPVATKADGNAVTNETATPVVTQVEAAPTKEEMQAEISEMIAEQMAQQAKEVEIEKEVIQQTNPNGMGMMQGQPAASGNYVGGSGYDPTVEMLKLEVDRLRSENSLLKNQQMIGNSSNNGYSNQSMGNQPMNGNNANSNYNNGMSTYGSAQNGGQSTGSGVANSNGIVDANGNAVQAGVTSNGYGQNVEQGKKGGNSKAEKKARKAAKKAERKAEKKAKKEAKKAAKAGNTETGEAKEKKGGFFGRIFNRNSDSVNVEEYSFNFVGDSFEMGNELQSQLKKIARKANKADDGKLIIQAETTKDNQAKTNTIGVKLAQILAEEYGVDAGRISYDIKDVQSSPNSNEENQKVSIKLIY